MDFDSFFNNSSLFEILINLLGFDIKRSERKIGEERKKYIETISSN